MDPITICVFSFGVFVGVWFVHIASSFNRKDYRSEAEKAKDAMKP